MAFEGVEVGKLLNVGPGDEALLARAGEHHALDRVVGMGMVERLALLLDHPRVERIELVGTVDGDHGNAVVDLIKKGFEGHTLRWN